MTIESAPRIGTMPIAPGHPITEYSRSDLVKLVRWVQSDGLLRTEDELLETVIKELGYGRRGRRIVTAITEAIHEANRR